MTDHFKVVHIHQMDEVEPVPHMWEKNGVLYWPPTNREVRQHQSDCTSQPDIKTWKKYACEVKESNILLFMHASAAAAKFCATSASSASESAEEDETSIKSKPLLKKKKPLPVTAAYDFYSYSLPSSTPSAPPIKNLKVATQGKPKIPLNRALNTKHEPKNPMMESLQTKYEVKKPMSKPIVDNSTEALDDTIKNSDPSSESLLTTLLDRLAIIETQIIDLADAFKKVWEQKIENKLIGFSVQLDRLEDILKKSEVEIVTTEEDMGMFPLDTREEVHKFDKDLADPSYKKKVFSHLRKMVGNNMQHKQASYRLCNVLFTKKVLTLFSWTGVSRSTSKDAFNKLTNILDTFYKVISKSDPDFTFPLRDGFFRDAILKHSNTRLRSKKTKPETRRNEERILENHNAEGDFELNDEVYDTDVVEEDKVEENRETDDEDVTIIKEVEEGEDVY